MERFRKLLVKKNLEFQLKHVEHHGYSNRELWADLEADRWTLTRITLRGTTRR